jgi:hypothetical protein
MAIDRSDPFRIWSDLALMGVKAYASAMATGLDTASRMMPLAPAFPAPAIRRSRPVTMWPAAGSFGSNNAVGAWVEATQAMLGAPRQAAFPLSMPWSAMPWRPFTPMPGLTAWPMGLPWGVAPAFMMPGFRLPFGAPAPFGDPMRLMRMMSPMLDAFTPGQRSFRYH